MQHIIPKTVLLLLMVIFPYFTACDELATCDEYELENCDTEEPEESTLIIQLTTNAENRWVPLKVYKGHIEDNDVVAIDTADAVEWEIAVKLNEYYSVTAEYLTDFDTIIAVDGDKIKKTSYKTCGETCWEIKGGYIDVRLKE